jgi:epoxyqueuosine reductase
MRHEDLFSSSVRLRLTEHGFAGRFVSFERVQELKDAIEKAHSNKLFDKELYRYITSWFDFTTPAELPEVRSVIIVAATHPALKVTFTVNGEPHETIIPPTYTYGSDQEACECLTEVLEPRGYRVVKARVPDKLLAVRSGLARYGKNNITYVKGMGSFHRLTTFYTDAPLFEQSWEQPQMLDQCETCTACVKKCPSGAIPTDRFLLRAEKCITFHNESEAPFPDWIDPSWHNCLIGCMICQNACPVNKPFVGRVVDEATFSEEETELILSNALKEDLAPETQEKLERIGMLEDFKLIPRNLKALLEAGSL